MKLGLETLEKIGFKSTLQHIVSIKKKNKVYDSLSDKDKRKEIAYDSILLMCKGILYTGTHGYWDSNLTHIQDISNTSFEFCKNLNKVKSCSVCARGAVMLSQIRLGNSIHPNELSIYDGDENTSKAFSMRSMEIMENHYERGISKLPFRKHSDEMLLNILLNVLFNGNYVVDYKNYLKKYSIKY